jgi:hypothetical protein
MVGKTGRPRKLTNERIAKIVRLRGQGFSWESIARETGLAPASCRRACWQVRKAPAGVVNSLEWLCTGPGGL